MMCAENKIDLYHAETKADEKGTHDPASPASMSFNSHCTAHTNNP